MGQYHAIYNLDKKEAIGIGGMKLLGILSCRANHAALLLLLSNSNNRGGGDIGNLIQKDNYDKGFRKLKNPRYFIWDDDEGQSNYPKANKTNYDKAQRFLELFSGRWAGDKIVIQGDYAEENDNSYTDPDFLESFTDISFEVLKGLKLLSLFGESRESVQSEIGYYDKNKKANWETKKTINN